MVQSGRDYRAGTAAAQASALLRRDDSRRGRGPTSGSARAAPSAQAQPPPGSARSPESAVPPDTTAHDITNPTRLAACLDALGVAQDRLVAVDLARYEGREAAILLLIPADGGGHEVWAVERTCAAGSGGCPEVHRTERMTGSEQRAPPAAGNTTSLRSVQHTWRSRTRPLR